MELDIRSKKKVLYIICLIAVLITSLLFTQELVQGVISIKEIWIVILGGIFSILFSLRIFSFKDVLFQISAIDFVVGFFFIFKFINSFYCNTFTENHFVYDMSMFFVYCLGRQISIRVFLDEIFYSILIIIFTNIQLVIGLLQFTNIIPTYYLNYPTGYFWNPNQYAIYICALSSYCFTIYMFKKESFLTFSALVTFVFGVSILLMTDCRAAWVSMFAVVIFLKILKSNSHLRFQFYTWAGILLFSFGAVLFLYFYKKDSVNSRFLVWKISSKIIKDNWLFGIGPESFDSKYLYYQAVFFSNPEISEDQRKLAGQVKYSFNDLLQLLVDGGCINLVLIIVLLWLVRNHFLNKLKFENTANFAFFVALISIAICSLFSYPKSVAPICALFCFLLGVSFVNYPHRVINLKVGLAKLLALILFFFGFYMLSISYNKYLFLKDWSTVVSSGQSTNFDRLTSLRTILIKHRISRQYPLFLTQLGEMHMLCDEYLKAYTLLTDASKLSADLNVFYLLGCASEKLGRFKEAEKIYLLVERAFPNLLRPKYLLANLYLKHKFMKRFKYKLLEIRLFKPKIEDSYTEDMRNELEASYLIYFK